MKLQVDLKVGRPQVGLPDGMKHLDVLKEVKLLGEVPRHTEVQKPLVLHQVRERGKLHQVMRLQDLLRQEISRQDIQHQVCL